MIRVRYRNSNELSPGLHAAAERHGRTTTVYLLAGLTAAERESALRRLRLSARMGHCPRLPAAQLALALLADLISTAVGRTGAVFRLHPAASTVPVIVLSGGAIAFLLFSTVSIRVLPAPRTATPSSAGVIPTSGNEGLGGPGDLRQRSRNGGMTRPAQGGQAGFPLARLPADVRAGGGPSSSHGSGKNHGDADPPPTSAPEPASSTPVPAASPSQAAPSQVADAPSQVADAPSQAAPSQEEASPEPAPGRRTGTGVCVNVGLLEVCLKI